MNRNRQRGVALITAMIISFAVVAMASGLTVRQQRDIHRTAAMNHAIDWLVLVTDLERKAALALREERPYAEVPQPWPRKLAPLDGLPPDSDVQAWIDDMQGELNVNDLGAGKRGQIARDRFLRLLEYLSLDANLANAIGDWVDLDSTRRTPGGAEDDVYTRLSNPYRSANRPIVKLAELRRVQGIDEETLKTLRPYISALPPGTGVNVNSAGTVTLQALHPDLDADVAAQLIQRRRITPFTSVDEFRRLAEALGVEITVQGLSVGSSFYLVRTDIRLGRYRSRTESVIKMTDQAYKVRLRTPGGR